ncbi:hypothetical protein JCM11641_002759 [Rhodosporidiobolus odoratus]
MRQIRSTNSAMLKLAGSTSWVWSAMALKLSTVRSQDRQEAQRRGKIKENRVASEFLRLAMNAGKLAAYPSAMKTDESSEAHKYVVYVGSAGGEKNSGGRRGADRGGPLIRRATIECRARGIKAKFVRTPEYFTSKRCSKPDCKSANGLRNGSPCYRVVACDGPAGQNQPHASHRDVDAGVNIIANGISYLRNGRQAWQPRAKSQAKGKGKEKA